MFESVNLADETRRVKDILLRLPSAFHLGATDADLCRYYLCNEVMGNVGVFENVPILHVHHTNVFSVLKGALDQPQTSDLSSIYYWNRSLFIITDGDVELTGEWTGGIRKVGPVFSDELLQIHYKNYKYRSWDRFDKESHIILDMFTASAIPGVVVPAACNFNYRMIRVHNPDIFKLSGHLQSQVGNPGIGPYGLPPSRVLGPPA